MRITPYKQWSVHGLQVILYQIEIGGSRFITPLKALTRSEIMAKQYTTSNFYLPDYAFICSSSYKKEYKPFLDSEIARFRNLLSSNNKIFIYVPSVSRNEIETIKDSVKYQYEIKTSVLAVPIKYVSKEKAVNIVKDVTKEYSDQDVFPVIGLEDINTAKEVLQQAKEIQGIILKFDKKDIRSYNDIHINIARFSSLIKEKHKLPIFIDLPRTFTVNVRAKQHVIESTSLLRYFFSGILSYSSRFNPIKAERSKGVYYKIFQEEFDKSFIIDPFTYKPIYLAELLHDTEKFEEIKTIVKKIVKPDNETPVYLLNHIEEAIYEPDLDKRRVITSLVNSLNSVIIDHELEEFKKDVISSTFKSEILPEIFNSFYSLERF